VRANEDGGESQSSGASRQTDSHALGYCIEKDLCLQGENSLIRGSGLQENTKGNGYTGVFKIMQIWGYSLGLSRVFYTF
jgi:hypothetical protein